MQIWYYSVCLRMLVCTDAWRLLLYFVDDLVAIGRGEAIDTMAYSADNGCRAVTAFPFQCTNAWLSFYMYISFFIPFELLYCFYYCLYLSEVTNKVVQSINKNSCFGLFHKWPRVNCTSRMTPAEPLLIALPVCERASFEVYLRWNYRNVLYDSFWKQCWLTVFFVRLLCQWESALLMSLFVR